MNRELTENTPLSMYTEFIHSADTIAGFMAILQRITPPARQNLPQRQMEREPFCPKPIAEKSGS